MDKKKNSIRSSAAEYLTFITATGESDVNAIYADEDVWLSQKMMGVLYNVNVRTVNDHLKKIFMDNEYRASLSYPEFSDNCISWQNSKV